MTPDELIDNMAKDALNFADLYISMHRDELIDQVEFKKIMIKLYNYTSICFEVLIEEFRKNIIEAKDTIYLYNIMNAKRRFNILMNEVENRLILAKLQEERRIENESNSRCETQSPK